MQNKQDVWLNWIQVPCSVESGGQMLAGTEAHAAGVMLANENNGEGRQSVAHRSSAGWGRPCRCKTHACPRPPRRISPAHPAGQRYLRPASWLPRQLARAEHWAMCETGMMVPPLIASATIDPLTFSPMM